MTVVNIVTRAVDDKNTDVLLTVHLSIFISVFNQLDAQNLSHNKFYFMLVFLLFQLNAPISINIKIQ